MQVIAAVAVIIATKIGIPIALLFAMGYASARSAEAPAIRYSPAWGSVAEEGKLVLANREWEDTLLRMGSQATTLSERESE